MIAIALAAGALGRAADVPGERRRPARDAGPARPALRPSAGDVAALLHRRRGRARSSRGCRTTSAASRTWSRTPRRRSCRTSSSCISTVVAMAMLSWQLTLLSLFVVPRLRLPDLPRRPRAAGGSPASTQESLAEMSAMTEETLSVSGVLLTKVFDRSRRRDRALPDGEPAARRAADPPADGRAQLLRARADVLLDHAGARLPRRRLAINGGSSAISAGTLVAFTALQTRLFFPVGQML